MTKIDTLALVKNIKVCTAYEINGQPIRFFPADAQTLAQVTPVYTDIAPLESLNAREWEQLKKAPKSALPASIQDYIRFVEDFVEVPVTILSHGPEREATIVF